MGGGDWNPHDIAHLKLIKLGGPLQGDDCVLHLMMSLISLHVVSGDRGKKQKDIAQATWQCCMMIHCICMTCDCVAVFVRTALMAPMAHAVASTML